MKHKFIIINLLLLITAFAQAQSLKTAQDYLEHSDFNNAIQTFTNISNKAKEDNNVALLIEAQNGIADCYMDMGTYYKAITILKKNISLLNTQKNPNNKLLGDTHLLLSGCYDGLNMFEEFLKESNTYYSYYKKAFPDKKIYKALYYTSVGRYYNLRLLVDKAYSYTNTALKIYNNNKKDAHLVDKYICFNAHLFTLRYYDTTYENRIAYQDSLIKSLNTRFPFESVKKARYYLGIAAINFDVAINLYDDDFRLSNANIAIDWYNKGIAVYDKHVGFYSPNAAQYHSLKGFMYFYKKDYKRTLENYEIGIKKISSNLDKVAYQFSNSDTKLIGLLSWKALCLSEMYQQNKDIKLLYETETTLLAMEKAWLNYANHTFKNKQSYNTNGYLFSPYTKLTNVYLNLYQATNKSIYLNKFFEYDEKSKYTALLENLYKEKNAIKQNNKTNQNRLNTSIAFDDLMLSLNGKISVKKTKKEYENIFNSNFQKFYTNQLNIFNSNKIVSLKEFQNKLKENEAFLSINHSRIANGKLPYLFLITKTTTKIIILDPDFDNMTLKVENLLSPLNSNDVQTYKKVAYEYYLTYFKPIENYIPKTVNHIKISPDSYFTNLPFDLLLYEKSNSINYSQLPYLVNKYQFSYSLSSTIETLVDNSKTNTETFSVFCPDFSYKKLNSLNLAKSTAKKISKEYNTNLIDAYQASKANFQKHLKSDKVVAVLSHGKANSKDIDETQKGIYLSDGFLSLSEVYNYKANTEFLILGACETGVGHIENNEGSINLARAFTSIGVKSMLLSSWSIDESCSMKIIKSFLKFLDKGDAKSAALQKAKLDYLATATPRTGNPLYWAGLNITGNNESIPLHKTNYYWYALGLIPLSFGLWFLRKKSRREKKITD